MGAWRTVFLCAAGVYVVDSVIFLIFGSSKSQPWNEPTLSKEKQSNKEEAAKSNKHSEPKNRKSGTWSLPEYEEGTFYNKAQSSDHHITKEVVRY